MIGMKKLQTIAAEVETALKNEENRTTQEQMDLMQTELAAVLDILVNDPDVTAIQTQEKSAVAKYDQINAWELINELEPLLESGNPECLKLINELKAIPESGEVVKQMEDFYFGSAAIALAEMKEKIKANLNNEPVNRIGDLSQNHAVMVNSLNKVLEIFSTSQSEKAFDETLTDALHPIADILDVNRIVIYRNMEINGENRLKQLYRWDKDAGGFTAASLNLLPNTQTIRDWMKILMQDVCVNQKTGEMTQDQAEFMKIFEIKSILMVPVFMYAQFWGCVLFQDHRKERHFDESYMDLIRSFTRLCANSIIHLEMERDVVEKDEFNRVIFGSVPLGLTMFNEKMEICECNEAILNLFGVTKEYYINNFFSLSPKFQPDGSVSREKASMVFKRMLEGERLIMQWLHCKPDGEPIPCEITATRTIHNGKIMGLVYVNDLRTNKDAKTAPAIAEK